MKPQNPFVYGVKGDTVATLLKFTHGIEKTDVQRDIASRNKAAFKKRPNPYTAVQQTFQIRRIGGYCQRKIN